MNIKEFFEKLETVNINSNVAQVEDVYGCKLPDDVKSILSVDQVGIFFGDNKRLLSFQEILTAEDDLHVGFKELNIIPVFDTGDNDFIVYSWKDSEWSKFNIVEQCAFKKRKELKDLLA